MSHRHHIDIFWSDEDDRWIATAPDLRPCSAHGNTPVAAVTKVEVAIDIILDHYREREVPPPVPSYRSETFGRIVVDAADAARPHA